MNELPGSIPDALHDGLPWFLFDLFVVLSGLEMTQTSSFCYYCCGQAVGWVNKATPDDVTARGLTIHD